MQAFFVLGLIPGTNIQINFSFWLIFFMSFVVIAAVIYLNYQRQIRILGRLATLRTPLPASLLHSRRQ